MIIQKLSKLKLYKVFWPRKHYPATRPKERRSPAQLKPRYLLAALLLTASTIYFPAAPARAADCDDVRFIFARGSGEGLNDISMRAWQKELTARLRGAKFSYSFYELGSKSHGGHRYPAVAVSDSFDGFTNLLGAYISGGNSFNFGASVEQGRGELKAFISEILSVCPDTKFVLGGYSQGAMVLSRTLSELPADKILYVATFGDPKLYLPEGQNTIGGIIPKIPDACRGQNLSDYRTYVPDCFAYEGVLGSVRPYRPEEFLGKVGTWCNQHDIMCSSGLSLDDHTSYVSSKLYADAAEKILAVLRQAFPEQTGPGATRSNFHEVAFLFDSTGSMASDVELYRNATQSLATDVLNSGGRIALFSYGDLEDSTTTKLCDFGCNVSEFDAALRRIPSTGGGDEPESTLSATLTVMNSLRWTPGATKSIIVMTDAGFHDPDRDGTTLADVVQRSLEIDPVNIYTFTPVADLTDNQTLAELTGGRVFSFADGETIDVAAISARPVAKLALSSYFGETGTDFTFDASESYGFAGPHLRYDWDLDGDGEFETPDGGAVVQKNYAETFSGFIQVKITDDRGYFSTMSANLEVVEPNSYRPTSITSLTSTPGNNNSATVNFTTNAERVLVQLGDILLGYVWPSAGKGNFIVTDLATSTNLTLIPISNTGRRGVSKTIAITPNAAEEATSGAAEETAPDTPLAVETKPTTPTFIPLAPNAGTVNF